MNNFEVTQIINSNTVRVSPRWELKLKGATISGDLIQIRGLDSSDGDDWIAARLDKLLLKSKKEIGFNAPEVIEASDHQNAIVSCSLYVAETNILYYFPEFVRK